MKAIFKDGSIPKKLNAQLNRDYPNRESTYRISTGHFIIRESDKIIWEIYTSSDDLNRSIGRVNGLLKNELKDLLDSLLI